MRNLKTSVCRFAQEAVKKKSVLPALCRTEKLYNYALRAAREPISPPCHVRFYENQSLFQSNLLIGFDFYTDGLNTYFKTSMGSLEIALRKLQSSHLLLNVCINKYNEIKKPNKPH